MATKQVQLWLIYGLLLVISCLGDAQSQTDNSTLTQDLQITLENDWARDYFVQAYDRATGWQEVCHDSFWDNNVYSIAVQLCDREDYKYGYAQADTWSSWAERVKYNVRCDDEEEKVEECTPTALYYTSCRYRVYVYCMDKKKFHEMYLGATIGMCVAAAVVLLGGVAFVVVRTSNFKKQQKAKENVNNNNAYDNITYDNGAKQAEEDCRL